MRIDRCSFIPFFPLLEGWPGGFPTCARPSSFLLSPSPQIGGGRMSLQRGGKSPVYKWCRILVREVGVKSADGRRRRRGHKPDGKGTVSCFRRSTCFVLLRRGGTKACADTLRHFSGDRTNWLWLYSLLQAVPDMINPCDVREPTGPMLWRL